MPLYLKERLSKAPVDNKSALSYWPGVSVAGSTKHIPGTVAVPVATKGGVNQRAEGPLQNAELQERARGAEAARTTYAQVHTIDPRHDYAAAPRRGGGYHHQQPAALLEPKPFLGKSTYQSEIAKSAAVASSASGSGPGGRIPAFQGAQPFPAPPAVKPGYLTQYTAASLPLQQKLGGSVGAGGAARDASLPAPAAGPATAPPTRSHSGLAGACAVMSRFEAGTTYGSMYSPTSEGRATEELNRGTAKASLHVPGYGGHVPSEADLVLAGLASRVKKEDTLLYHLDQHSRGLVPGYTGHRPAARGSVRLEAPAPTAATTQGAAAQQALRWGSQAAAAAGGGGGAALNSRAGVLSFFSSGGGGGAFVSENGQAEAATFHQRARPYEGLMKSAHSPSTNRHGAKFTS